MSGSKEVDPVIIRAKELINRGSKKGLGWKQTSKETDYQDALELLGACESRQILKKERVTKKRRKTLAQALLETTKKYRCLYGSLDPGESAKEPEVEGKVMPKRKEKEKIVLSPPNLILFSLRPGFAGKLDPLGNAVKGAIEVSTLADLFERVRELSRQSTPLVVVCQLRGKTEFGYPEAINNHFRTIEEPYPWNLRFIAVAKNRREKKDTERIFLSMLGKSREDRLLGVITRGRNSPALIGNIRKFLTKKTVPPKQKYPQFPSFP